MTHPISEIVRRLRREIMMLLQKSMGVIIDRGIRHLLDASEQSTDVFCLDSQQDGLIQLGIKMKVVHWSLTPTFWPRDISGSALTLPPAEDDINSLGVCHQQRRSKLRSHRAFRW